jgi:hypothetical protein
MAYFLLSVDLVHRAVSFILLYFLYYFLGAFSNESTSYYHSAAVYILLFTVRATILIRNYGKSQS